MVKQRHHLHAMHGIQASNHTKIEFTKKAIWVHLVNKKKDPSRGLNSF